MLSKYAKGGELERGNLNPSTVMCEADEEGGVVTDVGIPACRPVADGV